MGSGSTSTEGHDTERYLEREICMGELKTEDKMQGPHEGQERRAWTTA